MFGRGFGLPEIAIILVIILLLFGATRLPQIGASLGKGIREFKNGLTGGNAPADDGAKNKPAAKKPRAKKSES
jgi:sec-independent protein translocase protein TatA